MCSPKKKSPSRCSLLICTLTLMAPSNEQNFQMPSPNFHCCLAGAVWYCPVSDKTDAVCQQFFICDLSIKSSGCQKILGTFSTWHTDRSKIYTAPIKYLSCIHNYHSLIHRTQIVHKFVFLYAMFTKIILLDNCHTHRPNYYNYGKFCKILIPTISTNGAETYRMLTHLVKVGHWPYTGSSI